MNIVTVSVFLSVSFAVGAATIDQSRMMHSDPASLMGGCNVCTEGADCANCKASPCEEATHPTAECVEVRTLKSDKKCKTVEEGFLNCDNPGSGDCTQEFLSNKDALGFCPINCATPSSFCGTPRDCNLSGGSCPSE